MRCTCGAGRQTDSATDPDLSRLPGAGAWLKTRPVLPCWSQSGIALLNAVGTWVTLGAGQPAMSSQSLALASGSPSSFGSVQDALAGFAWAPRLGVASASPN